MNTSATLALANGMRAYFALNGPSNVVVTPCGWDQRPRIINQGTPGANRILLIPGKEPGGAAGAGGTLTRDSRPSTANPRALVTWRKDMTMSVWAVDTTDLHNEELQIAAVETLLELAVRAAHNAVDPNTLINVGVATIEWGAVRYTVPPIAMSFGKEVLVEFVHKCPLFDAPVDKALPQLVLGRSPDQPPINS